MIEPRFCYRISALAGLAHDGEGNHTSCFTEVSVSDGNSLSEEDYNQIHESLKGNLSNQLNIPTSYFECINQKEYDDNHDDE